VPLCDSVVKNLAIEWKLSQIVPFVEEYQEAQNMKTEFLPIKIPE
jgi:hypothetical protein